MPTTDESWTKTSWQKFPAHQQPNWPDQVAVQKVLAELNHLPPLVFAGEIRSLKALLAKAVTGDAFLLQGGTVPRISPRSLPRKSVSLSGFSCRWPLPLPMQAVFRL